MATVRPPRGPCSLFTGYTHDFYVSPSLWPNVGVRRDNDVMPCSVAIPWSRLAGSEAATTCPSAQPQGPGKSPGPDRGPVSVFAGVGAGNIFQRGTSCAPVILGGYASGATASGEYANVGARHQ